MFASGLVLFGLVLSQAVPAVPPAPAAPEEAPLIPAFFTAQTLYDICKRPNAGQCSMYVAGTLDGVFFMDAAQESRSFCLPPTTNRKVADAVVGYLEAHPDVLEKAAAAVVHEAVAQMYPCPPSEEPEEERAELTPVD